MPKSPYVRLMRRLQYFSPHGSIFEEGKQDKELFTCGEDSSAPLSYIVPPAVDSLGCGKASTLNTIDHEISVARWWIPPDVLQETYTRHLEGEIHLQSDLQPSSSCPLFLVEVSATTLFFHMLKWTHIHFHPPVFR